MAASLPGIDFTYADPDAEVKFTTRNVDMYYGQSQALFDVNLDILDRTVTALIGPSGCGKTTYLRCLNRMNDTIPHTRIDGHLEMNGRDLYGHDIDPVLLRGRIGMVFQKPNPFPKSVYENVAYGARIQGLANSKKDFDEIVHSSLQKAGLWEEVKNRLKEPGTSLSGGQQQRLCIARAIAVSPEALLMDEPCSSLDPISTAHIEELIHELRKKYCIVIVTHNMQQAARVAQKIAFFHLGKMVEYGDTEQIFKDPVDARTRDYVEGKFG